MTDFRAGRVYDPRDEAGGARILVDRLWPRGLTKASADLDLWAKDVAPSTELRQWLHANPAETDDFAERYRQELDSSPDALKALRDAGEIVTLLTASQDGEHLKVLCGVLSSI